MTEPNPVLADLRVRPSAADSDDDVAAIAALTGQAFPFLLVDRHSFRHLLRSRRPELKAVDLVAEDASGTVVACASTSIDRENARPGSVGAVVIVAEDHRRRGIGRMLLSRLEEHWPTMGATNVTGRTIAGPGEDFAVVNGFARRRTERISGVSLADVPPPVEVPAGITLRSLSEIDSLRPLYEIDNAVLGDIPSDEPWTVLGFDDWVRKYGEDPRLDFDSTLIAFDGDVPVAVSWLDRVADRVWSGLTGTRREYRGRGLAKVVKSHSLRRARERGATTAFTNNDATNKPMLAVNTWLGYRLHTEQFTVVRELG